MANFFETADKQHETTSEPAIRTIMQCEKCNSFMDIQFISATSTKIKHKLSCSCGYTTTMIERK